MANDELIAALERAAVTLYNQSYVTPSVAVDTRYKADAALIRAHIETLRAGQCRALGALPGKEPVMHLPAKKEP